MSHRQATDHSAVSGWRELALLRGGDAAAMDRVAAQARRVVGCRAYRVRREEQPDLVQQVVLEVWQAVRQPGFVLSRSLDALVRSVAYRRVIDWRRRRRVEAELPDGMPAPDADPQAACERREERLLGQRIWAELSEPCRQVLHLRMDEGLSYREIAERQGRSEGAVRNQMYKCLKRARWIHEELVAEEALEPAASGASR